MKTRNWLWLGLSPLALATSGAAQTVKPAPKPDAIALYKRADAPIPARVKDLLGRMTLEEKVAQLKANSTIPAGRGMSRGPAPPDGIIKGNQVDDPDARRALGQGLGAFDIVAFL